MFIYNEKTNVNFNFKLQELFKTIKADKETKTSAKNVLSVSLSNTLSPERTNLEASANVKEIYVFDIDLNTNAVPTKFIDALNKYVNFQILFRLHYNYEIKFVTSLKIFTEEKLKVVKGFESDWQKENKKDLPMTTKLENVFKSMVACVAGYEFRPSENFEEYAQRTTQIKKMLAEIKKQTRMMNAEKQPNVKMAMSDKIKKLKYELKELEE